jgi:uncharacterized glyoxalase superfamily protein PhnB
MTILAAIPVINCQNIQHTLDFYLQLFRFVVVQKRELGARLHWVHIKHGNTSLMLKHMDMAVSTQVDNPVSGVSIYLYVDNISEMHHFIKAGNNPVSDIVIQDYQMNEFTIADPEGNTVIVGQNRE